MQGYVSFESNALIAAAFGGEDEAVVFLPASGDVLIASEESVSHLCGSRVEMPDSAKELREFLLQLGVDML